jgi:hypothetical protein
MSTDEEAVASQNESSGVSRSHLSMEIQNLSMSYNRDEEPNMSKSLFAWLRCMAICDCFLMLSLERHKLGDQFKRKSYAVTHSFRPTKTPDGPNCRSPLFTLLFAGWLLLPRRKWRRRRRPRGDLLRIACPTDFARASTACASFRRLIAGPTFLRATGPST